MKCSKCGEELSDGEKFCAACGNVFDGCDSLHEIHVRGTPSKLLKKMFGRFGEYKKIKLVQE